MKLLPVLKFSFYSFWFNFGNPANEELLTFGIIDIYDFGFKIKLL